MAQDRINYLAQRLEEGAAIAQVIRTARTVANASKQAQENGAHMLPGWEMFIELRAAIDDLWDATYIELPDDTP